jgi:TPR repeat protein
MKTWLIGFCLSFAVCANAQNGASERYHAQPSGFSDMTSNQSAQALEEPSWQEAERQYKTALAEQAKQSQKAQKQIQDQIQSLKSNIEQKQAAVEQKHSEADSAKKYIETLRQNLLDKKKLIPKDPWREIYGEKKYLSADSGFVKFSGQIQEIAPNGIRVLGQYGNSPQEEYFVLSFPNGFEVGESIDTGQNYAAFENGEFHYVTVDGYAKSLPKLNYGKPCDRPKNADSVELAAQQLNDSDNERITNAIKNATFKEADIDAAEKALNAAQQALQDFLDANEAARKAAMQKIKAAQGLALKTLQKQADKGDSEALLRMGVRLRNGEDVETNLAKADECFKKADEAKQAINKLNEQAVKQQKFIRNLTLADRGDVECMIFVGKCYRDGNGVEKDLTKAREYFRKASDKGSAEATKLLSSVE